VFLVAIWPSPSAAACLELPSPELRELDQVRYRNPEQAITLALEPLGNRAAAHDPLVRAQLYLVIAFARGGEGRANDAGTALASAQREILQLPASSSQHILDLWLAMGAFGVAKTQTEYQHSLSDIDGYVHRASPNTLEWVCLLTARGDLQTELDRPDLAVADQLTAYHAARTHGWTDAEIGLALSLATTYRRSGLWSDAEAMINEVISYATQHNLTWLLALAEFTMGQIFVDERQWDKAFTAFAVAKKLSTDVGDSMTAALATLPLCDALINSGQIQKATAQCGSDFATFVTMGRSDLVTDSMIYGARIDLIEGRYASALSALDKVLDERLDDVPSRYKPRLYRERAHALSALGRYRDEAAQDLDRSLGAADAVAQTDRNRTVAVLTGISKAQTWEETYRALERENRVQRERLNGQQLVRGLSASLALAGLIASGVLAYLLYLGRRYRRELGRHAAVLGTLTHNLADTVMLLDPDQRVQFANRSLRDGTDVTGGCAIEDVVPPEAGGRFRRAIEQVIQNRQSADFEATWSDTDGRRYYEQRATPVIADDVLVAVTLRATDVTTRRALEDKLRLQAQVLDTMNGGVLTIDEGGRITLANAAMRQLLGYGVDELIGRPIESLVSAHGEGLHRSAHATTPAFAPQSETWLRRKDGSECLVAFASSQLTFASHAIRIHVCRDISVQRQIERALAGAASRDALRIGNQLHEGLAQELAGVSFLLSTMTHQVGGLGAIELHLTNAIGTAREMARLVSPTSTVSGSLELALRGLTDEIARKRGIPAQCVARAGQLEFDGTTSDQVYRIAQSAVQYATRRRNCSTICLQLDGESGYIKLTISWECPEQAASNSEWDALELELIGYRTRLLGGTCDYDDSLPHRGAIAVTIPKLA
jgi:PAS domain S-box-containing protein